MIPLDLSGKVALVTGVGDNISFAWYIAKFLQAAGARLIFAVHPRMTSIVQSILDRAADAEYRVLPYGAGELKVEKVIPCDVSYDTMADVPAGIRDDRRYTRLNSDYSISGMLETVKASVAAWTFSFIASRSVPRSEIPRSTPAGPLI